MLTIEATSSPLNQSIFILLYRSNRFGCEVIEAIVKLFNEPDRHIHHALLLLLQALLPLLDEVMTKLSPLRGN